jgi:hypothetical protein
MQALKFFALGFHHDTPIEGWFNFPVPAVSISRSLIGEIMAAHPRVTQIDPGQRDRRVLWLGTPPTLRMLPWSMADGKAPQAELTLEESSGSYKLVMPAAWAQWLVATLARVRVGLGLPTSLKELEESWELSIRPSMPGASPTTDSGVASFEMFLKSEAWQTLLEHGLILTQQQNRVIWMGAPPTVKALDAKLSEDAAELHLSGDDPAEAAKLVLRMPARWASWLAEVLLASQPDAEKLIDLAELKRSFTAQMGRAEPYRMPTTAEVPFKEFMLSPVWQAIRERGLALL